MKEIKLPLIAGVIGFIVILFINVFEGNSASVVFIRSLIYGIVTFGVFFGVIFVFKNYLGVDFKSESGQDNPEDIESKNIDQQGLVNEEDEKSSVDYIVGNDDQVNIEDSSAGFESSSFGSANQAESLANERVNDERNDYSREETEASFSEPVASSSGSFSKEEKDIPQVEDIDVSEYSSDMSYDDEKNAAKKEKESIELNSEDLRASFKKKIGVDVSFEDVAKAIRTKIKRD